LLFVQKIPQSGLAVAKLIVTTQQSY
jgi:hypothetical protein